MRKLERSSMTRTVQHRPSRESRRAREIADLKKSCKQLEAKNKRLRDELGKLPGPDEEPRQPEHPCPSCKGPTTVVDLGRMRMRVCKSANGTSRSNKK